VCPLCGGQLVIRYYLDIAQPLLGCPDQLIIGIYGLLKPLTDIKTDCYRLVTKMPDEPVEVRFCLQHGILPVHRLPCSPPYLGIILDVVNIVFVGFGISSGEQAERIVASGADGIIVGSALVDIVADGVDNEWSTAETADKLEAKAQELADGATRGRTEPTTSDD